MKTNLSYKEFHARIIHGHKNGIDDSAWRENIGYSPSDKDSGFKRWLELTGNKSDDFISEFKAVVYGENCKHVLEKKKNIQLEFIL